MTRLTVLDTNVLVSGILSGSGPPGQILDLALSHSLGLGTEPRMLAEYRDVLARPHLSLNQARDTQILGAVEKVRRGSSCIAVALPMPDQDDEVFIATAHALGAILVTGNIAHYPQPSRADVPVMTSREFIDLLRQSLPGRV
ncbi:MAG: putative toxin-antitoxin system toxin component, PIN family [Gammaproteobacteria bacterium]